MKNIFIVGGNGFARECFYYILDMAEIDKDISFGGFLGHNGFGKDVDYLDLQKYYKGDVSEYNFSENDFAVIGAGYPGLRSKIYYDLKTIGVKLINLIPPFVFIKPSVEIGEGNIFVAPFAPGPNVKIGNGNLFNGDVVVGHDAEIGDFNFFGGRSQVLGRVKIGNNNTIGTSTVILADAKIGNGNKIAPLSAVYKGCKDYCYIQGNPALNIGSV